MTDYSKICKNQVAEMPMKRRLKFYKRLETTFFSTFITCALNNITTN